MNRPDKDTHEWLVRHARRYLSLARRFRKAGDPERARVSLHNARRAYDAAKKIEEGYHAG